MNACKMNKWTFLSYFLKENGPFLIIKKVNWDISFSMSKRNTTAVDIINSK
jgi:hypothetical protein